MGAVYVAEHVNTGGQWALKVMLDTHLVAERAARFRREARASARITSEHVVRVTDADIAPELGGAPFLVMELLSGQDLERRLTEAGPLAPSEVLEALTQVARGLEKAHAAGVVHRDLKPENVFLHRRDDGGVIYKVLDFGISKLLRPETDPGALSATGSSDVMGTPLYMAPEQAAAKHDLVGPGTDVWALALMAHRMLTGVTYWQGQSVPEVFVEIMSQPLAAPSSRFPSLPASFDAWFAKSCAFRVTDRYASVTEQIAALSQALDQAPNAPFAAQAEGALAATQVMSRPTPDPSSGKALAMIASSASTAAPLSRSTPPPPTARLKSIALVGFMVLVVSTVVGAVLLLRDEDGVAAHPDASPLALTIAPAAPVLTPSSPRTDAVALLTPDASVEVDGKSVAVDGARFEITGSVGSVHDVHVHVGSVEQMVKIVMAESGPIPSAVGLPPPSAPPVVPPRPAPRPSGRPAIAAAPVAASVAQVSSASPGRSCDPPFTIDSVGHHVLKPGCE